MDREQFILKLENEINNWKYQKTFEAQCKKRNKIIRHFNRLINKLYEQIKQLNELTSEEQINGILDSQLNLLEEELQKLKRGNLWDLNFNLLQFYNVHDGFKMEYYSGFKVDLQRINQDMEQANKLVEQILNHDYVEQEKKEIREDIFYQNGKKICLERFIESMEESLQNCQLDINESIVTLFKECCDLKKYSQRSAEERMRNIVISAQILSKEMKCDLKAQIAANIIEDILDYK